MTTPDDRPLNFGTAAREYDRRRLAPPPDVLDWMLAGRERVVLDLASGTGQIARQLDRPGLDVVAVEPDDRMRALLAHRCPHARVLAGVAEDIPLGDGSVDAVLVGSAWHWFDHARADAEIARVLRPGGRLAACGIAPDPFEPWVAAIMDDEAATQQGTIRTHYRDVVLPPSFGPVGTHEARIPVPMSPAEVRAFFTTISQYLSADDAGKARLAALARRVLDERFPGAERIDLPMGVFCWRAERVGQSVAPGCPGPAATTHTIRRGSSGQYQIRPPDVTSYCHCSSGRPPT